MTAADLVIDALRELGVLNATDPPGGEDAALGLTRLNLILDAWNADRDKVYADTYPTFTLTPSLNPHTIGLVANAPTWNVTINRPVSIEGASLVINSIRFPITIIRDSATYFALTSRAITSAIPSALYYDPTWPNGSIYFYLVPSAAYTVELRLRTVLAQLLLTDTFTLPPGYQAALTYTLAEHLAAPFKVQLTQDTKDHAREARATIFTNNVEIPSLHTRDAGLPGGDGGWFDYRSGLMR